MEQLIEDLTEAARQHEQRRVFEILTLVALSMTNPALSRDDRRRQAYLAVSKAASKAEAKQR